MATLSTPRKHGSTFWTLTLCALFVAVLVLVVAVLLAMNLAIKDAIFIMWTSATGHGGGRPQ